MIFDYLIRTPNYGCGCRQVFDHKQKFFKKKRVPLYFFLISKLLRLIANRKLAVAVAVGNLDRNSGYDAIAILAQKGEKLQSLEMLQNVNVFF